MAVVTVPTLAIPISVVRWLSPAAARRWAQLDLLVVPQVPVSVELAVSELWHSRRGGSLVLVRPRGMGMMSHFPGMMLAMPLFLLLLASLELLGLLLELRPLLAAVVLPAAKWVHAA